MELGFVEGETLRVVERSNLPANGLAEGMAGGEYTTGVSPWEIHFHWLNTHRLRRGFLFGKKFLGVVELTHIKDSSF